MKICGSDSNCRVAVIGLGLIGGSFAARVRVSRPGWTVIGHDVDPDALARARRHEWVHTVEPDRARTLSGADVVLLAVPVGAISEMIPELPRHLPREAIVLDVGSTKAAIVEALGALPERIQGIGGHPMTGAITAGVSGPSAQLFEGKRFVLCPASTTRPETMAWARELLEEFGAVVREMDAAEHDRAVAVASHLPYLAPIPLLETLARSDDAARDLVAGGFRSRVRGAGANIPMWLDILCTNREAIAAALASFRESVASLEARIESASEAELREMLAAAADAVRRLEAE